MQMLRARRQQLHAAIAAALEREFPEIAATQPELLAHHYTEAGLPEPRGGLILKATHRAGDRQRRIYRVRPDDC